jgi:hypothetical protein
MSQELPDFTNDKGFRWYRMRVLTDYARDSLGLGASVWLVKHPTEAPNYVLLVDNQVVADSPTMEGVAHKIDVAKLLSRDAKTPPLRQTVEDLWSSHERFSKEDWKAEVVNDTTHLGYWEWVDNQLEQSAHDQTKID